MLQDRQTQQTLVCNLSKYTSALFGGDCHDDDKDDDDNDNVN